MGCSLCFKEITTLPDALISSTVTESTRNSSTLSGFLLQRSYHWFLHTGATARSTCRKTGGGSHIPILASPSNADLAERRICATPRLPACKPPKQAMQRPPQAVRLSVPEMKLPGAHNPDVSERGYAARPTRWPGSRRHAIASHQAHLQRSGHVIGGMRAAHAPRPRPALQQHAKHL